MTFGNIISEFASGNVRVQCRIDADTATLRAQCLVFYECTPHEVESCASAAAAGRQVESTATLSIAVMNDAILNLSSAIYQFDGAAIATEVMHTPKRQVPYLQVVNVVTVQQGSTPLLKMSAIDYTAIRVDSVVIQVIEVSALKNYPIHFLNLDGEYLPPFCYRLVRVGIIFSRPNTNTPRLRPA